MLAILAIQTSLFLIIPFKIHEIRLNEKRRINRTYTVLDLFIRHDGNKVLSGLLLVQFSTNYRARNREHVNVLLNMKLIFKV